MEGCAFGAGRYRTRVAFSFPMGRKIKERLGQALAGGARPRRIWMGSSPSPPKRKTTPNGVVFLVDDIGLELHFFPIGKENKGVAAVETGGKQMSTGHLHLDWFESLSLFSAKKRPPFWVVFFLKTNHNFNTNAPPFEVRGCKVNLGGAYLSQGVQNTN